MNYKLKIRCQHDFEPFARKILFAQHGDICRDQPYIQTVLYRLNAFFQCGDRQIFNLPPRHLKTSLCTIGGAAWQLGRKPIVENHYCHITAKIARLISFTNAVE
jgi:hypothetical protein